jgi:hypothetical protein
MRVQQLVQQNQRLLNYVNEILSSFKQPGTSDVADQLIDLNPTPKKVRSLFQTYFIYI